MLCALHFEPSQFLNDRECSRRVRNAVPSLFDDGSTVDINDGSPEHEAGNNDVSQGKHSINNTQSTSVYHDHTYCQAAVENVQTSVTFSACSSTVEINDGSPEHEADRPTVEEDATDIVMEVEVTNDVGQGQHSINNIWPGCAGSTAETPRKRTLRRKLHNCQRQLNRQKEKVAHFAKTDVENVTCQKALKTISKHLALDAPTLLAAQIRIGQTPKHLTWQWAPKERLVALALFYQSTKAYRFLYRMFYLPCRASLCRSLQKITATQV